MNNKIKVQIYGVWDKSLEGCSSGSCGGCPSSGGGCPSTGGCHSQTKGGDEGIQSTNKDHSCSGCGSKSSGEGLTTGGLSVDQSVNTTGMQYEELVIYLQDTGMKSKVDIEFLDMNKINILDFDDIRVLDEMGYESPFTVIEGIVRYYGGISKDLIYKDIQELIE